MSCHESTVVQLSHIGLDNDKRDKSSCIIPIFDPRINFSINSLPYCLILIPTTLENFCSKLSIVNLHFNSTLATEKDLRLHIQVNPFPPFKSKSEIEELEGNPLWLVSLGHLQPLSFQLPKTGMDISSKGMSELPCHSSANSTIISLQRSTQSHIL
jgi:hypothetical protein